MPSWKAASVRIVLTSAGLLVAYAVLLRAPQPLFPFSVRADNLTLYSDQLISEAAGKRVLKLVGQKLAFSPLYFLYSSRQGHNIFVCHSRWRQVLLFNKDYGAGGVAQYPVTANVFLRDALIEDNRLLSPRGNPVMGDRTLDYFIAHEITHQLTGQASGPFQYYRLPQWVREGYADYVGKGNASITTMPSARFLRECRQWTGRSLACTGAFICW
jgi:hypothetical protein